jgi:hypothetical protein
MHEYYIKISGKPFEIHVESFVVEMSKYLVFINDLLINLDNAKGGAMLLDLRVSSSVQTDDIALLSPTVNGMQTPVLVSSFQSSQPYNALV